MTAKPPATVNRRLRVLIVCAMGKQRSATAAAIYRHDARLEVRSAGVRSESARRVTEDDIRWADAVIAMEEEHALWISTRFEHLDLPAIHVLDIPDEFGFMDAELQGRLKIALGPKIDSILARRVST